MSTAVALKACYFVGGRKNQGVFARRARFIVEVKCRRACQARASMAYGGARAREQYAAVRCDARRCGEGHSRGSARAMPRYYGTSRPYI